MLTEPGLIGLRTPLVESFIAQQPQARGVLASNRSAASRGAAPRNMDNDDVSCERRRGQHGLGRGDTTC